MSSVESYMHKAAKTVLVSWLREIAEASDGCGFLTRTWPGIRWRVNRGAPTYGVWEEWPISGDYGANLVWDETYWPVYLEKGLSIHGSLPQEYYTSEIDLVPKELSKILHTRPPTYEECLKLEAIPEVILDVAIQHKGTLSLGFEIVHKNDVSDIKLQKLQKIRRRSCLEVYRIPAAWVLSQVGFPQTLVGDRII